MLLGSALGMASLLASGCGDSFVATSNGGASGAGAAAGSSAGDAGDVGEAGQPGEGGAPSGGSPSAGNGGSRAGNAGGAGKPGACDCPTGSFCDANSECQSCKDFSSIHFTTPEKLATLSQVGTDQRFPRAGGGTSLFYTSRLLDRDQIWFASSPASGVGVLVSSPQIESAALLAPGFVVEQNLFFSRGAEGSRKIVMGNWNGMTIANTQLAPLPINTPMADDYSFAVAPNAERAYWMSNRNGQPELLWQSVAASGGSTANKFDAKIGNCDAQFGDDATPWVDLDGTVLLFRSQSQDADCQPTDSGAYDLFVVGLAKDGKAATRVAALSSLNTTGGNSTETDPSLSSDLCTIYFASNNGGKDFDLYRAERN